MANQFGDTLKEIMESRYNISFKEAMKMLADRGLNRNQVAEELGCSHSTVIKHSLRLGVEFTHPDNFEVRKKRNDSVDKAEFEKQLKKPQVTSINVLSKKWCDFSI